MMTLWSKVRAAIYALSGAVFAALASINLQIDWNTGAYTMTGNLYEAAGMILSAIGPAGLALAAVLRGWGKR